MPRNTNPNSLRPQRWKRPATARTATPTPIPQMVPIDLRNDALRSGSPGTATLGLSSTKKHQNSGNEVRQLRMSATTSGLPSEPEFTQSQAYSINQVTQAQRQPATNWARHFRAMG